ncbi:MAG: GspH/FimT family pseudopilin [Comamonadaceae bacterium]|nr:GspH/FimT family pseudopilin [Comamonadaceae bacterium]
MRATPMSLSKLSPAGLKAGAKFSNSGFTLMELIVTMALAAVVLTLGIPMFSRCYPQQSPCSDGKRVRWRAPTGPSEAIKRGVRVTLCKSMDGTGCASGGGYEQGWIVFVDPNDNATVDAGGAIIRVFEGYFHWCQYDLDRQYPCGQVHFLRPHRGDTIDQRWLSGGDLDPM